MVGHIYYFLEDVFPHKPGGLKLLRTPRFLTLLFHPDPEDEAYPVEPTERPGGFDWGGGQDVGAQDVDVNQANQ